MLDLPIRFRPLIKQAIWGGRRLHTSLGKTIGDAEDYAESWEIVDHGNDQSIVADGPMEGKSLGELMRDHTADLMGAAYAENANACPSFPLLFKFLDCNRVLSVQVHPNDEQGSKLTPPDLGKTEAWVILHSEPESIIYAGLKPGIDQASLAKHIEAGTTEQALHSFHPNPGDCVFIPAGTVHALGGGLLVAEIQQSSNTTFRLFDWNRTDASGHSRPLHVAESLAVTDYRRGPVEVVDPILSGGIETLVQCDKFDLHRIIAMESEVSVTLGDDDQCHLLCVIDGTADWVQPTQTTTIPKGETVLMPASMPTGVLKLHQATALWMTTPRV